MKPLAFVKIVDKLEDAAWLDPVVTTEKFFSDIIRSSEPVRDLLHGVPVGHPVHPVLVQVPLGAWFSAALLDALPGTEAPARTLVGAGTLSAVPAALAGYVDYGELDQRQARIGAVHAGANFAAVGLHAGSYVARVLGNHGLGKWLSYTGLTVAGAGGYLGGHLTYRQGAGVERPEFIPRDS